MANSSKNRLPVQTFSLPVQKIRRGYYSAVYFWREKQILEQLAYPTEVLMQVFQKNYAVVCGVDEALAVLRFCSGRYQIPEVAHKQFDQYLRNTSQS